MFVFPEHIAAEPLLFRKTAALYMKKRASHMRGYGNNCI